MNGLDGNWREGARGGGWHARAELGHGEPLLLDHSCKTSILTLFIKSRTTLFKTFPACYKLVKQ